MNTIEYDTTKPPRPVAPTVIADGIPFELKQHPQWLVWKFEWNAKREKWDKIPYSPKNHQNRASSTSSDTWSTYEKAIDIYHEGHTDGIGFVVTSSDPFLGIDLDKCLNKTWANDIIMDLDSYTEKTPSGNGYRIWIKATKPEWMKCKSSSFHNSNVEVYDRGRYFTVTGHALKPSPIYERHEEFEQCLAPLDKRPKQDLKPISEGVRRANSNTWLQDGEVIELLKNSPNKRRAYSLYIDGSDIEDQSACDMTLANELAWATGSNIEQMKRIMRCSALYRPKYDEMRGDHTYLMRTILEAIQTTQSYYWPSVIDEFEKVGSGLSFSDFVLNGKSEQMRQQMLDDVHVLGEIALLGQWTVIYAKPNAGKTLLTIWMLIQAIKRGVIDGHNVFYVNADDHFKGVMEKTALAEEQGFQIIAPGHNSSLTGSPIFKAEMLLQIMANTVSEGTAKGTVVILDTLKKFTDLMDKKKASDFGTIAREFVAAGGTLICLAHVNKHNDEDGKPVFAGTSDISDDADCCYTLRVTSTDSFTKTRTIIFENFKNRGDVASEVSYEYDSSRGINYIARLKSIVMVSSEEQEERVKRQLMDEHYRNDKEIILTIKSILAEGEQQKTDLIAEVMKVTDEPRKRVKAVLERYTGDDFAAYQYWSVELGDKNAHYYKLNSMDEIVESLLSASKGDTP